MSTTLKKQYDEKIAPALMKQFNYSTPMQIPRLQLQGPQEDADRRPRDPAS